MMLEKGHLVDAALFLQSTERERSPCGHCFISAVHRAEKGHLVGAALFLQSTEIREITLFFISALGKASQVGAFMENLIAKN